MLRQLSPEQGLVVTSIRGKIAVTADRHSDALLTYHYVESQGVSDLPSVGQADQEWQLRRARLRPGSEVDPRPPRGAAPA